MSVGGALILSPDNTSHRLLGLIRSGKMTFKTSITLSTYLEKVGDTQTLMKKREREHDTFETKDSDHTGSVAHVKEEDQVFTPVREWSQQTMTA